MDKKQLMKTKEKLTNELHKLIDEKGTTHKDTVKKSQELDKIIVKLTKRAEQLHQSW